MTPKQWSMLAYRLGQPHAKVELECDGYRITACVRNVRPLQQAVVVYVNGAIDARWITGQAEEPQKFHCRSKRYLYSARDREKARRIVASRTLPENLKAIYAQRANAVAEAWLPYWTNARQFLRHLREHCARVDLLAVEKE